MDTDKKYIFREKNLQKASDPEQLNRYLKVTGFGSWVIVTAGVLIVVAVLIWVSLGKLDNLVKGAAECTDGTLTCYFRSVDMEDIKPGMHITVGDKDYRIEEIDPRVYLPDDLPRDVLYFSIKSDWYRSASLSCDLADGTYQVMVDLEPVSPISFLTKGSSAGSGS